MNEGQKYLLDNNINDTVINKEMFPANTVNNANKWVYLSDLLEHFYQYKANQLSQEDLKTCSNCNGTNLSKDFICLCEDCACFHDQSGHPI